MKHIIYVILFLAVVSLLLNIGAAICDRDNYVTYDDYQRFNSNSCDNTYDYIERVRYEITNKIHETMNNEPNFTDVVAQSVKSVVHVKCPYWQGSGFIIDKHIICTARHVVDNVEDFEITFNDGRKASTARAISDKEHDVGFIWIEDEIPDHMIAKVGSIKDCKLGQDIFIVGSSYGDENFNSVSRGIISGLNRNWDDINWWTGELYGWKIAFTSDSAAHPGNSGGAIFTTDGIVRGILVGGYSPVLNCSMPCDLFLPDIEQIKRMFIMDRYQFEEKQDYNDNY